MCDAVPAAGTAAADDLLLHERAERPAAVLPRPRHGHHATQRVLGERPATVITDAVDQDMINGTNVSGVNPGLLKDAARRRHPAGPPGQDPGWTRTPSRPGPHLEHGTGPRDPAGRSPPVSPATSGTARLHDGAEPVGPRGRQPVRFAGPLRSLVQPAGSRVRERSPGGLHRARPGPQRVLPGRLRADPARARLHGAVEPPCAPACRTRPSRARASWTRRS